MTTLPYQRPGRLGRDRPLALEVTHILDEVPPHLIADQLVAEARRVAGVPVGLYVVDIDGSRLIRLAGSEDFPETLDAPPAIGPEIVPEGLPAYYERLRETMPRCEATPLWLRGRVLGLLLCVGMPLTELEDVARQGAAALELANDYTDLIESARRRKPTTAAAEVQHHLLPPRIARITGAQLAGGLLPTYEVGGDWFDYVENRDGAWLAIADAAGTGPTAAGLGASALGALRAARRSGQGLEQAAESMDEVIRALGNPQFTLTAILARWHAPTSRLTWINCGHPPGFIADPEGTLTELDGPVHAALGSVAEGAREFELTTVQLRERRPPRAHHRRDHRARGRGRRDVRGRRPAPRGPRRPRADRRRDGDGDPARGHELLDRAARGRRDARRPRRRLSAIRARRERCRPGALAAGSGRRHAARAAACPGPRSGERRRAARAARPTRCVAVPTPAPRAPA